MRVSEGRQVQDRLYRVGEVSINLLSSGMFRRGADGSSRSDNLHESCSVGPVQMLESGAKEARDVMRRSFDDGVEMSHREAEAEERAGWVDEEERDARWYDDVRIGIAG